LRIEAQTSDREEFLTRSKPFAFLALLILSLSVTALAQTPGDENGPDQVKTAEAATINWLEKNAVPIGAVAALLVIIEYLTKYLSRFVLCTIKFVQTNWLEKNAVTIRAVAALLVIIEYLTKYLSRFVSCTIKFVQTKFGNKNLLKSTIIGAFTVLLVITEYLSTFVSCTMKFVQTKFEKKPPEGTSSTQQISGETRTMAASGKGNKAIRGGVSGSIITDNINQTPEALGSICPKPTEPPGKISNFPHLQNPNFTGREELLDRLHEALSSGQYTALSAITGLGGVGKTQLALEYAYHHKENYDVLWWVRSEEPVTLAADYAGLATKLDLPENTSSDQGVIIEAVRCWLEKNEGWLLVFDNAQNFEYLEDYLPRAGKGHVIITSRNQHWGGVARMLSVDVFNQNESVEFLLRRTEQNDEGAASALADALGNLPLALEQAGAYIEETGTSLASYLKLFQERQKELLSCGKPAAYPDTVATIWNLSFQKTGEKVPASADLLNLCAFLAPDDIPKSILAEGLEHLPEPLASAVANEMLLNELVAALKRYSLLNVAGDSLSVHRVVQAVTRDRLKESGLEKTWAEVAVRLVNGAFQFDRNDVQTWPVCSLLLPHALATAEHAEKQEVALKETGYLLNRTGLYLRERAEFSEAKSAFERALKIDEKVYSPDNRNVARVVNNLGGVLKDLGDLANAKKSFERALNIDEKVYGPDHPNVARDINNLGEVLRAQGEFKGAKGYFEQALKIDEKVYDPDHPNVAIRVNNLGAVLRAQGDLEGAKSAFERALEIDEKVYGPDHPNVATVVNNLGGVLQDMGNLEGARKLYERALKICEEYLPEDHPNTKTVRNNLESLRR